MAKTARRQSRANTTASVPKPAAIASPARSVSLVRILSGLVYGLFLASLFVPLVYNPLTFYGFGSERSWVFYALVEVMTGLALWQSGFWLGAWSGLHRALLVFGVVVALANAVGVDPQLSFFSGFARMDGFTLYIHLYLYFLTLTRAGFSKKQWHIAFLTIVVVALLVVGKGVADPTGRQLSDNRFVATIGNPSFLAIYLLIVLFVAVYVSKQFPTVAKSVRLSGLALVVAGLGWAIVQTGTRSAIVGLVAGGLLTALLQGWQRLGRRALSYVGGGIVALVILFVGLRAASDGYRLGVVYRFTHLTDTYNTVSPRFQNYRVAANALTERPWLGWGQETYNYGFARQYNPALVLGSTDWYDRAHSVPLDWAYSAGVLGLLAYVMVWVMLGRSLYRNNARLTVTEQSILAGAFVAYFVFNLTSVDSLLPLQLAVLLMAFVDADSRPAVAVTPIKRGRLVASVIGVGLLATLGFFTSYDAYRTLRQLDRQQALGNTDIVGRVNRLGQIHRNAVVGQTEVAFYAHELVTNVLKSNDPVDVKQVCYDQARTMLETEIRQHPNYTRLKSLLAALLLQGGNVTDALTLCQQVLTTDGDKRPSAVLQLGDAYLRQNDLNRALATFERAGRLEPRWDAPRIYSAWVFAIRQDSARCHALLRTISNQALTDNLYFVKQVYTTANYPQGFLNRITNVPDLSRAVYSPQVYAEWVLSAFDLNQPALAIQGLTFFYYSFRNINHADYARFQPWIAGIRRGVRPDGFLELVSQTTAQLPPR